MALGTKPVLVVGGGMAGLACALELHSSGVPVRIFEASDDIGGRVRTDKVDGYLLDRGFQVYLDAYPETGKLLDLKALDLRAFEPGALIYKDRRLHRLMDVFRRPAAAWSSATAPVGSLFDKGRVGLLRHKILRSSFEQIASREDLSTKTYLRNFGFSEAMIDQFFRAFYGGIFLERELRTSSRMFEFTFKLFGSGSATLPAKGMGEIPKQLAARLPAGSIQLNQVVQSIDDHSVTLDSGETIAASAVVIATDGSAAQKLLPELKGPAVDWRSVTNLYFAADQSPVNEAIICLNGSGTGLVNNVCVLTDAAPAYAPHGKSLLSVSLIGLHHEDDLTAKVQTELGIWFGSQAATWHHLRTDRIQQGLPEQAANRNTPGYTKFNGVYICGDHLSSASIEGAVVSGQKAARALLVELNGSGRL